MKEEICEALERQWVKWPKIKDTVTYFGFDDYINGEFGLKIKGYSKDTFDYVITDEKKFMWFMLGVK